MIISFLACVKNGIIWSSCSPDFGTQGVVDRFKQIEPSILITRDHYFYNGKKINILDTPCHRNFAEDTFRTLTAVDSVILVIDVAKGVEEQTEKLVDVCRKRTIPMIVFINKLQRDGTNAFDYMVDVAQNCSIHVPRLTNQN